MTQRDILGSKVQSIIVDAFKCGFDAENSNAIDHFDGFVEARELLEKYAIGKWVPVSERLPNTGKRTYWDGMVLHDGTVDAGTFGEEGSFRPEYSNITHWLELDIAEVES